MKTRRKTRKSPLKKAHSRRKVLKKANTSSRLISRIFKGSPGKSRERKDATLPPKMSNKSPPATGSTNELNDAQPTTSRQAAALIPENEAPSTSQLNIESRHPKKSFIKFKDDKYRAANIRKYKSKLKKKTLQSSLHLSTIATPTASQIVSRKILRSVKKRRNPLSRPNTNLSPTEKVSSNKRYKNLEISISNPEKQNPIKTKDKNDDLDDDCVCIDPQPEVILIDDETITACSIVKQGEDSRQKIKDYEPIGSMRMNDLKHSNVIQMFTSTPNARLLNSNSPSRVPFYGDTIPMLMSDSLLSGIEDCTLVEKNNKDSDVVVIDDTIISSNNTVTTRKRKTSDDSVIFVSERVIKASQPAPALAFIPLDTPAEESHFRIIPSSTRLPRVKRLRHSLFSSKEQKQIRQYNENAYNPNKDDPAPLTKKRMVIVDGSNVAYGHALNKEFSVKGLKICLDYFEKMGHEVKAVVPQYRLQKLKSSDPNELEKLHREGKIVFTPCKNLPGKSSTSYDDRFVLQLASELDAAVVSNDNYRDLIHENPAFKKIIENRVVGYTWCNDLFILPKDPYGKWGPTLTTILNRS